jgi:hypothetical protein
MLPLCCPPVMPRRGRHRHSSPVTMPSRAAVAPFSRAVVAAIPLPSPRRCRAAPLLPWACRSCSFPRAQPFLLPGKPPPSTSSDAPPVLRPHAPSSAPHDPLAGAPPRMLPTICFTGGVALHRRSIRYAPLIVLSRGGSRGGLHLFFPFSSFFLYAAYKEWPCYFRSAAMLL